MRPIAKTDFVLEHHLAGAQAVLNLFGIADPTIFAAQLRKAVGTGKVLSAKAIRKLV